MSDDQARNDPLERMRAHYATQRMSPDRLAAIVKGIERQRVLPEDAERKWQDGARTDQDAARRTPGVHGTWEYSAGRFAPSERPGHAATARRAIRALRPYTSLAAALVLAVALGTFARRQQLRAAQITGVASEIALNHHKALELDVEVDGFEELAGAMPLLDFSPMAPGAIATEGYRLLGARYCSIGGSIAAQIRLVDSGGVRATLYELRESGHAGLVDHADTEVDGLRVRLWREGGLLMGLARPIGDVATP